jgi:hypothetical protein
VPLPSLFFLGCSPARPRFIPDVYTQTWLGAVLACFFARLMVYWIRVEEALLLYA